MLHGEEFGNLLAPVELAVNSRRSIGRDILVVLSVLSLRVEELAFSS